MGPVRSGRMTVPERQDPVEDLVAGGEEYSTPMLA
jgi:hypothetical protein